MYYNTPRPAAMSCTILVVLESVTHESLYQCLPDLRRRVNSQKISIKNEISTYYSVKDRLTFCYSGSGRECFTFAKASQV